jgi:hypothetical protein
VRNTSKETGPITHDEAEQLALACIDAAFGNAPLADGRRFRASIPVDPRTDTDIRLMAYIKQQRAKDAGQPAATEPQGAPCPDCNQTGRHMCEGRRQVVEPPPYECNCPAPYPEAVHDLTCPEHLRRFPEDAAKGAPQKPEGCAEQPNSGSKP